MKIRTKIIITFFSVAFLGAIFGTTSNYLSSTKIIKNNILSHLETTAADRSNHIETYLKQNIERLKLVTSRNKLRSTLKIYNQNPTQDLVDTMQEIIADAKDSVEEIERICIVGLDGFIITSTNEKFLGIDVHNKDFFINGKIKNDIYFVKENGVYKIFVSGPFTLDGELIGVGITVVSSDLLELIVKDKNGLGETGEVLIAIKEEGNRKYIFERLFEKEAVPQELESPLVAEPMKQALAGKTNIFENTLDYRNKAVFAASEYIKTGKLGLVVKIDKSETMGNIKNQLLINYILIFIIIVFTVTLVGIFIANTVVSPIIKLKEGVEIISEGDYNYKTDIKSKDEVGLLAIEFNKMAEAIKKSRESVEIKVKEQTKNILSKQKELRNQQKAVLNILEDVEAEKQRSKLLAENLKERSQNLATEKIRLESLLENVGDGIIATDQDGKITTINNSAESMTGWTEKEVIGKSITKILKLIDENGKEISIIKRPMVKALSTGKKVEISPSDTYYYVRRDGTKFVAGIVVTPFVLENKIIGTVQVFRDITLEKSIDKAKTEFVSLASHQLRTPLSAISWYTEMLLAGDAGKINKEQKDYLNMVYKGNQRMIDLVNSLLNVSRLELGTFTVEPKMVNMTKIAESVLEELVVKIKEKKLVIHKKYKPNKIKIKADPELLRIVFQNFLSNAVKYNKEKGTVGLNIEKQKNNFLIRVSDTGMGIPRNSQSQIFEKLYRADNVKEKDVEGTGLGLYIVKQIIEHSGGKVWFESAENKGSTFYATLPLSGMPEKKGTRKLG